MSLVDIVTLDDTWSDIHATPAALNPLVGLRRQGDAMAIITYVATPQKSLGFTIIYVWHLLERMYPPQCVSVQTFLLGIRRRRPKRILQTPHIWGGWRSPFGCATMPPVEGEKQASVDDGRCSTMGFQIFLVFLCPFWSPMAGALESWCKYLLVTCIT
jgi:hypothetical protein